MHRACLGGSPTWHFHILRMLHPSGTVNRDSPLNFGSWVFIRFSLYRCDWMNHWPCDWSQPLPQYMHVHALTHTHTHAYTYICVHTILMHAHTYLCMHTRLSTHTYSHLHICSHSCEHIHSHIHTCSFLSDCLLSELGNQIGSDRETCL